jgi:hypothetical protein
MFPGRPVLLLSYFPVGDHPPGTQRTDDTELGERIAPFSSIDVPYPVPLSRILLSGTHHGRTVSVRAVSTHITFPT